MKLLGIYLYDFQQFKDFELEFTYPAGHEKAGEPLEKICFIGRNGTGKSTLLNIIQLNIPHLYKTNLPKSIIYNIELERKKYYFLKSSAPYVLFYESLDEIPNWKKILFEEFNGDHHRFMQKFNAYKYVVNDPVIKYGLDFKDNSGDLLIYVPSEGNENIYIKTIDVPKTTLNEALKLFEKFPYYHLVSTDSVKSFWDVLTYQVKKRDNDFHEFQNFGENLDKTVREVQEEFEHDNPKILDEIAILWNRILGKANLEFDSKNASNPIQLTDNLKAYIKLSNDGRKISYNQLSSGIRNFIFRLGHIFSLYFNRTINNGFLLIDEPENNLYPDFLYDLIDTYFNITQNTQFFVATHSPIIAAQFQPYERIILDFNEDGTVYSRKGETPIGDDPNDMLVKDFGVRSLLGKEGVEKWERYLELERIISATQDREEKIKLLNEFIEIGNAYNFSGNEVS